MGTTVEMSEQEIWKGLQELDGKVQKQIDGLLGLRLRQQINDAEYEKVRKVILLNQDIDPDWQPLDIYEYSKYALRSGEIEEKREIIKALGGLLYIHQQFVCSSPVN